MAKEDDNKAIVGRWFTDFWGKTCNLDIVDELAAPDMLLQYSLHEPRRGHEDIKAFMTGFRKAFPDLNFWGAAELIAEGDYVVGRWEGGGTHTGPAFSDFPIGSLPAATGRKMHSPVRPYYALRAARSLKRSASTMVSRRCSSWVSSPPSEPGQRPPSCISRRRLLDCSTHAMTCAQRRGCHQPRDRGAPGEWGRTDLEG